MKVMKIGYSRAYRAKLAIHYVACYLSVSGLGFLFACLILGATEYLLPLAVMMVGLAVVSFATNPEKTQLEQGFCNE